MSTLAENLKREMEAQGLTQEDLARASGVTQPAIYKLVNGKSLKSRYLPEIANALGIGIEQLMGLEPRDLDEIVKNPKFERIKAIATQLPESDLDKAIEYMEVLASNNNLKKYRAK